MKMKKITFEQFSEMLKDTVKYNEGFFYITICDIDYLTDEKLDWEDRNRYRIFPYSPCPYYNEIDGGQICLCAQYDENEKEVQWKIAYKGRNMALYYEYEDFNLFPLDPMGDTGELNDSVEFCCALEDLKNSDFMRRQWLYTMTALAEMVEMWKFPKVD